jgi:hypothetical protein
MRQDGEPLPFEGHMLPSGRATPDHGLDSSCHKQISEEEHLLPRQPRSRGVWGHQEGGSTRAVDLSSQACNSIVPRWARGSERRNFELLEGLSFLPSGVLLCCVRRQHGW